MQAKRIKKITRSFEHPLTRQGMLIIVTHRATGEFIVREESFEGPECILRTFDVDAARSHWTMLDNKMSRHGFTRTNTKTDGPN
jgi:hypothetical protein